MEIMFELGTYNSYIVSNNCLDTRKIYGDTYEQAFIGSFL